MPAFLLLICLLCGLEPRACVRTRVRTVACYTDLAAALVNARVAVYLGRKAGSFKERHGHKRMTDQWGAPSCEGALV